MAIFGQNVPIGFDIFVWLVCNLSCEQLYATNLFGHFYTLEKRFEKFTYWNLLESGEMTPH